MLMQTFFLLLASLVSSQSPSSTTTSVTAVASGSTLTVDCLAENNAFWFSPDNIKAEIGSHIEFKYHPRNHSVVQSSFEKPCTPLGTDNAIYSGFFPVGPSVIDFPTYTIRINDTDPIWLYCSLELHCQVGMVAVINPPNNQTLAQYAAAAKKEEQNISPAGGPFGGVVGIAKGSASTTSGSGGASSGGATAFGGAVAYKAKWVVAAAVLVAGTFLF